MTYRDIEELQNLLDKDIRGVIAKGDISPKDYQCLDVAVDISKDLAEIAEKIPLMEEAVYGGDFDNSFAPNNTNNMNNSGAYYNNSPYQRTRGNMRGANSRVYSGHTDMKEKLNTMLQNAATEQERQIITKIMKEMETM